MQEWEGLRALLRAPDSDGSENMCESQQTTGKSKGDDFMNSYLCYSFTIKKDSYYFIVWDIFFGDTLQSSYNYYLF